MTAVNIRDARPEDQDAITAFTADTWPDRSFVDYIPEAFTTWVENDDPDTRLVVGTTDSDEPVGVCRAQLLTAEEAWIQGIRVHPSYRGTGVGTAMTNHLASWAAGRGGTVMRNMVFGWNTDGLAHARAVGFRAVTALRWAHPTPTESATPELDIRESIPAAWATWSDSATRATLGGLALDSHEPWAVSELTRERLETLAETERVLAVVDGGARGMTVRVGVRERRDGNGGRHTVADYGIACWMDSIAAESLVAAIQADAAACGATAIRVAVPETPTTIADVATTGTAVNDEPEYILARDLVSEWS